MTDLPVLAVLPQLLSSLLERANAVLVAPPGAGKTTAVAPALLGEKWCDGEVLLLSPRRIAARAAAERMASIAGESVGRTFGYATRMDSRRSVATRVTVMTEGIFVARIQADPELSGVSAVLFDEVHERGLDTDFGLALALDAQAALRPDLRLIAMSATLDGSRFATLLGDAPVIESEGRSYPLDLRYIGRRSESRIEDEMAAAIRRVLRDEQGGVLAFLPGVAEIERTAERLGNLPGIALHALHGQIPPQAQRTALAPQTDGRRKLVLATSIAETSLTLEGICIVVDSGLARRPRYDRAAGMTRLVTERASQAAATQRAGRAARQRPGVAYRLWEEAATAGMTRFDPPEILEADLSALVLDCAIWGVADPRSLAWLDPPPHAALDEARTRLFALEEIDADARPTAHGRAIARLPMAPRLAHMLLRAGEIGLARDAADVAVLLGERGLGGGGTDLELRARRFRAERGPRAHAARRLAERWSDQMLAAASRVEAPRVADRVVPAFGASGIAVAVALAFPDRVSRRRDASGERWVSLGGRGFKLDPADPLATAQWLAVSETQGIAAGARILSAAAIDQATIESLFADRIATTCRFAFDASSGAVDAVRERRLGAVVLASGPDPTADPAAFAEALLEGVREHGLRLLPWGDAATALRARASFAAAYGWHGNADDAALLTQLDAWLPPLVAGKRRLSQIRDADLTEALRNVVGWDALRALDCIAPARLDTPAGSSHAIDYAAEAGPTVELRPQALFGLSTHPTIAGGEVPLVLSLTSPAGRAIQTTRDLPGFWAGSWASVAKEMRGRYPRHPWPDDPAGANATLRTKNADARARKSR